MPQAMFRCSALEETSTRAQNSVITSGADVVLSADTGITIAQIDAQNDITLVITTENAGLATPAAFSRANEQVPIGEGDQNPDLRSAGAVVFLAPLADVGGTDADQNFVQRSDNGIFYGLDAGQFFSDDIGSTAILGTIPADTTDKLSAVQTAVLKRCD